MRSVVPGFDDVGDLRTWFHDHRPGDPPPDLTDGREQSLRLFSRVEDEVDGDAIWVVDRAHDLVVVMRWMDSAAVDRFLGLVIGATG